jgi:metalloendopeptidase OMA1, mitochondrial
MCGRRWRSGSTALFSLVLCAGFAACGCGFPAAGEPRGEGPGHREQVLALSPRQELELGRRAYQEVLNNPRKYGPALPADSPECRRVRAVTRRIIRASEIEPLQREINLRQGYTYEWEVNVLENDQVNAFCLPGGKVAVFTGILRVARNDDQLATVISHEIAHALAHHSSERLARQEINAGGAGGFWSKAYDRADEAEADHIGVFLMTFADYDPEEAVRFWERMERATGGRQALPEILSDHPSDAHRIQQLKQWVPKVEAAKKAFDEGRIVPPPGR